MSQVTKSQLQTNFNTDLADNIAGDISAADIRNNLIDFSDSVFFTNTALTASTGYFSGAITASAVSSSGVLKTAGITSSLGVVIGRADLSIGENEAANRYINCPSQLYISSNTGQRTSFTGLGMQSGMGNSYGARIFINGNTYGSSTSRIELSKMNGINRFVVDQDTVSFLSSSVFFYNLPTTEPATSGQLWLSGSAGSNSKVLCVRN